MFFMLQFCFMIFIAIVIVSQIIVPALSYDLPFFWLFRKSYKELQKAEGDLSISKLDKETKEIRKKTSEVEKE